MQCMHRGGVRTVMITGDYHLTGLAVAKEVGMVAPQSQVVIIDTISPSELQDVRPAAKPRRTHSTQLRLKVRLQKVFYTCISRCV